MKYREEQCMADYQGLYTYVYLSKTVLWTFIPADVLPSERDWWWDRKCGSVMSPGAASAAPSRHHEPLKMGDEPCTA